ncbi:MAG: YIP1 family protein [Undibacterium sp.]|nr:YIP1 family protein [Undibacterium sp.]
MTTSALSVLTQLFMEPSKAFVEIKERPRLLFALCLITIPATLIFLWYANTIDFAWWHEDMMSNMPANMNAEQRAVVGGMYTQNMLTYGGLGGILLGTPILLAVTALYFLIASKVLGSSIPYGKWFSFATWTAMPGLLVLPLMILQIVSSHGRVSSGDLNMLSLNFLTVHLPMNHPMAGPLNSLSLTTFLTIFLAYVGLKVWTGRSALACATTSILPYAVIFGGWFASAAFK